jgi:putative hydrolase of the HAD superfamily
MLMGRDGCLPRDTGPDLRKRDGTGAIVLDFYGTLARATRWVAVDEVLAEHGVELDEQVRRTFWNDGLDGVEHLEHSHSRDHYVAWQQERLLAMLSETDLHPGEYDEVVGKLRAGNERRVLEAYDESAAVLTTLRERGLALAICSNWDWDLAQAVDEAGLTDLVDLVVSSAWAGARKPHPRIFGHTLDKLGVEPAEVLFVGDTWGPDVVGPRAFGMTPVYLRRSGHWPDDTAPHDLDESVVVAPDLNVLLQLVPEGSTP